MRGKDSASAAIEAAEEIALASGGARVATVLALSADGMPELDLGELGRVPARLATRASRERLEAAVMLQQQAVVLFENGDRMRPIIVGFIERPGSEPVFHTIAGDTPHIEADVDGRRVKITAADEIVLQCGSASITLRRNGRVVVRGTYVETHSDGTNRIKGGQVQIN